MSGAVLRPWSELTRLIVALVVALAVVALAEARSGRTADDVTAAPPVTSSVVAARSISIAVTGELLPHPSIVEHARRYGSTTGRPYDFAPLFEPLRPVIESADLAICHLEVPVAPPGSALSGYPSFAIPADIGAGIAATGWDRCSTASNHVNDQGTAGIRATLDALDAAGVGHHGSARTAEEAAAVPIVEVAGVRVAHLSYTWGYNASAPAEHWMSNVLDEARVLSDARVARGAGAEIVVLSLHWGTEYDRTGSAEQRGLAARLLDSPDVDLVVGHGPHVLQPVLEHAGEHALLSVGNLVANQGGDRPATYDGVVAVVTFTVDATGGVVASPPVVHPTWYDRDAGRVRLVDAALADPALAGIGDRLAASRARTAEVLGPQLAGV